jgi:hypothetical protein
MHRLSIGGHTAGGVEALTVATVVGASIVQTDFEYGIN